jgi:hypothetical protein
VGVDKAAAALAQNIGQAKLTQYNADRNYNLAAKTLGLKSQALTNQFLIAKSRQDASALQNDIVNRIKQGQLDVAKATLIYKQNTQAWRAKNADANRQQQVALAKFKQAGADATKQQSTTSAAAKYALQLPDRVTKTLYPGVTWSTANPDQIRQVVRNSIGQLYQSAKGLSQADAVRILGSALGANRLADFGPLIASYWPK